jgi:TRAP-type C4-dicarboxylate transport system permease small subunit
VAGYDPRHHEPPDPDSPPGSFIQASGTMIARAEAMLFRLLEVILVLLLAAMVVMVFGNVVLRYAFNSGLDVSEELSRVFFVWLTFIATVVVMREQGHLGIDTLTGKLGTRGRKVCMVISDLLILACCAVLFIGTLKQHAINAGTVTPVTGLSMAYVYSITYFTAVAIALIAGARLWRASTGRLTDAEIRQFAGEYSNESAPARSYVE